MVRHDDGTYALLNVELDRLTPVQRLATGVMVWEQVRALMEINGEYKPRDPRTGGKGLGRTKDIDNLTSSLVGLDKADALNRVRPRLLQRPDIVQEMLANEVRSFDDVARALDMRVIARLDEGRESKARMKNSYFGRGDKFIAATEPLVRYMTQWRNKNYLFTHVNPKEAKRRVKRLDQLIEDLQRTREDLAARSHVASYAAPQERRKGER